MMTKVASVSIFKILSDTNRLRTIHLLMHKELCVCHIAEVLGMSQTNISHHLSKLYAANMVQYRKEGQWIYYRINEEFLKDNYLLFEYLKQVFSSETVYADDIKTLNTVGNTRCRA